MGIGIMAMTEVMTFRPDDNQPNGVYNLNDISIYDLAYNENYITYHTDGRVL